METKEFIEYVVTANCRPVCGFRKMELAIEFLRDYKSRETGEAVSILKHVFSVVDVPDTPAAES